MNNIKVSEICQMCKLAANGFAAAKAEVKNAALLRAKELLLLESASLKAANLKDIEAAAAGGRNAAFIDRLTLTDARIRLMAESIDQIVALPDPVGEIVESCTRPNGLKIERVRAPLGVIAIIFEARPNVAMDAAALCIKSGNGVLLRGSKDSSESVNAIVACIKRALCESGLSADLVGNIDASDRASVIELLAEDKYVDVAIPRGGEALKKVVLENARMPVIASSGGNCHMYFAPSMDEELGLKVMLNAKTQRPSVCNALETLLVERGTAKRILAKACELLASEGVEIRGDGEVRELVPAALPADGEEWYKEYDDMIIKIKIVSGLDEAIAHINKYGTHHSDAIITRDAGEAERFLREVDSAAVFVNASTRFTDGFEFGLGSEMGISTQKLHVRGPIGLKELTSVKYVVRGSGQIRE